MNYEGIHSHLPNLQQQQQLLKVLEEVLREIGIPEINQQELLSKLLKS